MGKVASFVLQLCVAEGLTDHLLDKLVYELLDQTLKARSFNGAQADNTTLGKATTNMYIARLPAVGQSAWRKSSYVDIWQVPLVPRNRKPTGDSVRSLPDNALSPHHAPLPPRSVHRPFHPLYHASYHKPRFPKPGSVHTMENSDLVLTMQMPPLTDFSAYIISRFVHRPFHTRYHPSYHEPPLPNPEHAHIRLHSDLVPFLLFINLTSNETVVALVGDTNRTKLELFGWHILACNLSEEPKKFAFYGVALNESDTAHENLVHRLWESERLLLTSGKEQDDDASEKKREESRSFVAWLDGNEERVHMIQNESEKDDVALEAFMDTEAAELDGRSWRALHYDVGLNRSDIVSRVKALMVWFKHEFPYYYGGCQTCDEKEHSFLGIVRPTEQERATDALAGRTELYACNGNATHTSRFPRYRAVNQCLQTRRGRCGEYSVLSLRMLQLLNYSCRYTVDWADHVWVEVMSDTAGPPIHADPCEASVDEPLLYQSWGKNQTFIVSFPMDKTQAVEDVTARYTSDFEAVLSRRAHIDKPPDQVIAALAALNSRRCGQACRGRSPNPFAKSYFRSFGRDFF